MNVGRAFVFILALATIGAYGGGVLSSLYAMVAGGIFHVFDPDLFPADHDVGNGLEGAIQVLGSILYVPIFGFMILPMTVFTSLLISIPAAIQIAATGRLPSWCALIYAAIPAAVLIALSPQLYNHRGVTWLLPAAHAIQLYVLCALTVLAVRHILIRKDLLGP